MGDSLAFLVRFAAGELGQECRGSFKVTFWGLAGHLVRNQRKINLPFYVKIFLLRPRGSAWRSILRAGDRPFIERVRSRHYLDFLKIGENQNENEAQTPKLLII